MIIRYSSSDPKMVHYLRCLERGSGICCVTRLNSRSVILIPVTRIFEGSRGETDGQTIDFMSAPPLCSISHYHSTNPSPRLPRCLLRFSSANISDSRRTIFTHMWLFLSSWWIDRANALMLICEAGSQKKGGRRGPEKLGRFSDPWKDCADIGSDVCSFLQTKVYIPRFLSYLAKLEIARLQSTRHH